MTATFIVGLAIVAGPSLAGWRRSPHSHKVDEQRFLAAVHSELRSGASLRWALADAAGAQDCSRLMTTRRLALAGAPMGQLADSLRRLPGNGQRIGAAIEVAAESGGRSIDLFLRLADRAAFDADIARQQRTLTTQARLSALVVGGMPLLWLAFGGLGRLQTLIAGDAAVIAAVGLAMETVGALLVWRLAAS